MGDAAVELRTSHALVSPFPRRSPTTSLNQEASGLDPEAIHGFFQVVPLSLVEWG
ncbi:hypothetical protein [Natrinema hispanicum]|uniref:hypothetical protein n=1 Tax=Natrinema hispanicum TaxID=392421 RepID=UPI0013EE5498|nr:hypothetical protein [Natrinema hispanicum]